MACWQLEKKKMDAEVPMLLPKSNSKVSVPRWAADAAFCCTTQVCVTRASSDERFESRAATIS